MTNPGAKAGVVEVTGGQLVAFDSTGQTDTAPAPIIPRTLPKWAPRAYELDVAVLRWHREMPENYQQRLADRLELDPETGCWRWLGGAGGDGYGQTALPSVLGVTDARGNGARVLVHRAVLAVALGRPLKLGYTAGHRCADEAHATGACLHCANGGAQCPFRRCAAAAHLGEQKQGENRLASVRTVNGKGARTIVCPAGHATVGETADLDASHQARGWRGCRRCKLARGRARDALIATAHRALGVTRDAYVAVYGESATTAAATLASHGIDPAAVLAEKLSAGDLEILRRLDGFLADLARSLEAGAAA